LTCGLGLSPGCLITDHGLDEGTAIALPTPARAEVLPLDDSVSLGFSPGQDVGTQVVFEDLPDSAGWL